MGAKIDQNRSKNEVKMGRHLGIDFLWILVDFWRQVGRENGAKSDPKMESRWEGILASIFNGFWWIFGSKLGGKMEPKSIQEGIEKTMGKWKAPRSPQDADKRF